MNAIPNTLATSVSKRKLIKNIKDLYSAKGTKEGHELFMRILLGEEAEIFYPNIHMLRTSDGDWRTETTLRCSAFTGVSGDEVVNQVITGQTSGATLTPSSDTETVTLANSNTLTLTTGYANPELQPDSGNIIYLENRKPIQRDSDQTEDIKLIIEF